MLWQLWAQKASSKFWVSLFVPKTCFGVSNAQRRPPGINVWRLFFMLRLFRKACNMSAVFYTLRICNRAPALDKHQTTTGWSANYANQGQNFMFARNPNPLKWSRKPELYSKSTAVAATKSTSANLNLSGPPVALTGLLDVIEELKPSSVMTGSWY